MVRQQLIAGRATAAGTRRFAERFANLPGHFRCPDQLTFASVGLGTRSGEPNGADDLAYRSAVARALELGCNVFDSAIFYRMQTSERALGAALARAFAQGVASRDEIFVASKCGYLTVDPTSPGAHNGRRYLIETYIESGLVDPERVVNGMQVLNPAFVRDQIRRSRHNLGLATLDLYCIDQPELHQLALGPSEFRAVLAGVFEALEGAVADGEIAAYGIATWTGLLVPYMDEGHLSVVEVFQTALDVGGADHHFRAIQLPYSLGLADAVAVDSQFGPDASATPVLEALRDTGTAVFACAPLMRGRALGRLSAPVARALPGLTSDAQRCLQFARSTPGITTALAGMRELKHVEDCFAVARSAVLDELFSAA